MTRQATHGNSHKQIPTDAFARTHEGTLHIASCQDKIAGMHIKAFEAAGGSKYFIKPNDQSDLEHCLSVSAKAIKDIRDAPLDSVLQSDQEITFTIGHSQKNPSILLATNIELKSKPS